MCAVCGAHCATWVGEDAHGNREYTLDCLDDDGQRWIVHHDDLLKAVVLLAGQLAIDLRDIGGAVSIAVSGSNALEQLQSLASAMASVTLASIQQAGRIGGFSDDDRKSMKDEVLKILEKLDLPAEQLEMVMARWHPFVEFDYALCILGGPHGLDGVPDEHRNRLKDLRGGGLHKRAKPQDIAKFLETSGLLTDDRKEMIRDYEHYLVHRKHRRPEVWRERENWGRK